MNAVSPATKPAADLRINRPRPPGYVWLIVVAMILAGFAGLDRVVHSWSLKLATAHPTDADFYEVTRTFWDIIRWPVTIPGALAVYFATWVLHPRHWRIATAGMAGVFSAGLTTYLLQGAIGRLRPDQSNSHLTFKPMIKFLDSQALAVCFPSGEATAAFAIAAALCIAWPRWRWIFLVLAGLVAMARLVQGAHFLSDVTAGAAVGWIVGTNVCRWCEKRFERIKLPLLG